MWWFTMDHGTIYKNTVDGWNLANQLRLVVYQFIPLFTRFYTPSQVGCLWFQPSTVSPTKTHARPTLQANISSLTIQHHEVKDSRCFFPECVAKGSPLKKQLGGLGVMLLICIRVRGLFSCFVFCETSAQLHNLFPTITTQLPKIKHGNQTKSIELPYVYSSHRIHGTGIFTIHEWLILMGFHVGVFLPVPWIRHGVEKTRNFHPFTQVPWLEAQIWGISLVQWSWWITTPNHALSALL